MPEKMASQTVIDFNDNWNSFISQIGEENVSADGPAGISQTIVPQSNIVEKSELKKMSPNDRVNAILRSIKSSVI
jgi:hypothetical protein